MSAFGIHVGWLALRVTVVAMLARLLILWTRKRGGRSNVAVVAAALLWVVALTAGSVWPVSEYCPCAPVAFASELAEPEAVECPEEAAVSLEQEQGHGLAFTAMVGWLRSISMGPPESSIWKSFWTVVGILYLGGVAVFGIHMLMGWLALSRLRRGSRVINDTDLRALAEDLRAKLSCRRRPVFRECDEPGLAATLGWRRPTILVPPEWRSWSVEERRAVLSHELAHVRHADYLVGLFARLCQVVHFYQPLVRSLTAHLRYHQEVAADALAAGVSGGRESYVKSLARLAKGLIAFRPAVWFKQPGMEKASAMLDEGIAFLRQMGVTWPKELRPERIDQYVSEVQIISMTNGKHGVVFGTSAMFIRMDHDFDWLACARTVQRAVKQLHIQDKTPRGHIPERTGTSVHVSSRSALGCAVYPFAQKRTRRIREARRRRLQESQARLGRRVEARRAIPCCV